MKVSWLIFLGLIISCGDVKSPETLSPLLYEAQIEKDLLPFKASGITQDLLRKAYEESPGTRAYIEITGSKG